MTVSTDAAVQPADLDGEERNIIEERKSPSARVVHEVVREQGIEELERPAASLFWSGLAAGVVIWLSVIVQGGVDGHLARHAVATRDRAAGL